MRKQPPERERDEGAGMEMDGGAAQSSAQNEGDRGQDNFPSATLIGVGSSPKIPNKDLKNLYFLK